MRRETIPYQPGATDISIEYPNATHFAFVPAIIRITQTKPTVERVQVTIRDTTKGAEYAEVREPFAGTFYFDIRRYLQIMFDDIAPSRIAHNKAFIDSPLKRTASVDVEVFAGREKHTLFSFLVDALWGAISARESSGGIMRRKWFTGYPFTIDVFARYGTSFDVLVDGKQSDIMFYCHEADATGATPYHRYLLDPTKIIKPDATTRTIHIAAPHGILLLNDTESIGLTAYSLDLDCSTDGVYLRWIDRQGRYCYYLFRETGSAATVSAEDTWEAGSTTPPTAYVNGVNIESFTRQQLQRRTTRSVGARLVDAETFDFLLSLAQAVIVDVFDGYDIDGIPQWHRVNIVPGGYEKTTTHCQDFIVSIEEPTQNAQIL